MKACRVAFFTDCLHEVNGVALTSREFVSFARRRQAPFLAVAPAAADRETAAGAVSTVELGNGRFSLGVESDLRFDAAFARHRARLRARLERFAPDVVHITSPGHIGILGAILAHDLRVPLAASWHTNLHEFAARRLEKLLGFLPHAARRRMGEAAQAAALAATLRFYRLARLTFAPNPELVDLLRLRTGRPCFPMPRGVDTALFNPARRRRGDSDFVIGYVGRLTPEKNVRLLARLERELRAGGIRDYRLLIVGQGSEREWLAANLQRAELPGVLKGDALADAYAAMDVFAFPSTTDTYGNVVQEALASGVPAVVTDRGGPKFLVRSGENGLVASGEREFVAAALCLRQDRRLLERLRLGARGGAPGRSWDAVFEGVYRAYGKLWGNRDGARIQFDGAGAFAPEARQFAVFPPALSVRTGDR